MNTVENYVAKVEQLVNPVDWVPFLSSYSGMVRILAGAVEIAASIVFAAYKMDHVVWNQIGNQSDVLAQTFVYALHGLANIVRGSIAMLPGLNLSLYFHDFYTGRMNYTYEIMKRGVYPLMTAQYIAENAPRY